MLRAVHDKISAVPTWWLEPALASLLFALVIGTGLGYDIPANVWASSVLICLGAALAAILPFVGATLTLIGLLTQLTIELGLIGPAGLVVAVHVFAAVRLRLRIVPLLVAVLGSAEVGVLLFHTARGEGLADKIAVVVLVAVLIVLSIGAGIMWRRSVDLIRLEREATVRRLQDLRLDLARDLHDTVAQTLSHASMRSYMVAADPALSDPTRDELEDIAQECSSAAQDLRQLLSSLRDSQMLDEVGTWHIADAAGLQEAVEQQAQRLTEAGFLTEVSFAIDSISAARATTLAKITVEATSNMIKHSTPGGLTRISMQATDDSFVAEYSNPTRLREIRPTSGFGLVGIRERANLLKGTCSSELLDGRWLLRVTLPTGYEVRANMKSPTSPR